MPWIEKDDEIKHDLSKKCHITGTFSEMYTFKSSKQRVQQLKINKFITSSGTYQF